MAGGIQACRCCAGVVLSKAGLIGLSGGTLTNEGGKKEGTAFQGDSGVLAPIRRRILPTAVKDWSTLPAALSVSRAESGEP